MANFYTRYSSVVAVKLTPEEKAWCERALQLAERRHESRGEIMPSVKIDHDTIWVQDDDGGDIVPDRSYVCYGSVGDIKEAVRMVQTFLKRWRPKAVASIEYAHTCDRPRIGAFGGGAVVFTAETVEWINTSTWAAELMGEFQAMI